ncbi:MAG: 4Fe-4S binding protein [Bacillota bacterium]|nr:4Fe-4S binding protein [Bacillota bacterium]
MDKKQNAVSKLLSRWRGLIQAGAALLTNIHLPNFFRGGIYQGNGKAVCVPGLNCYSCPAASGACPIGAFQSVVGSSKFGFSYYITGFLILLGVMLGRFICGFLCPFGWFQDLLHKIPGRKFSTRKLKPLTYLKYVVLALTVILLPALVVNDVGMGDPIFCKYICPQGVLEGAIPLAAVDSGIRAALGVLFTQKLIVLIAVLVLSILFYRPFCKWICPLGAFYGLMNKVSLMGIKVDDHKCVSCGKCAAICKMDVDITKSPNHSECIRCGKCINACPTNSLCFRYGLGNDMKEKK